MEESSSGRRTQINVTQRRWVVFGSNVRVTLASCSLSGESIPDSGGDRAFATARTVLAASTPKSHSSRGHAQKKFQKRKDAEAGRKKPSLGAYDGRYAWQDNGSQSYTKQNI
jgi:hypothetical protein